MATRRHKEVCGSSLKRYARNLNLTKLTVHEPGDTFVVIP